MQSHLIKHRANAQLHRDEVLYFLRINSDVNNTWGDDHSP